MKRINNVLLRKITLADCSIISKAFEEQGWEKPVNQYENYLALQEAGHRDIILAIIDGKFAGYLTINWQSDYPPFREQKIPEIVDFNVLKKYQRLGIGAQLMDE
ncbi:MAG: GNAT family N-acetyltransferase, partial [Bacteroidota bacterium]